MKHNRFGADGCVEIHVCKNNVRRIQTFGAIRVSRDHDIFAALQELFPDGHAISIIIRDHWFTAGQLPYDSITTIYFEDSA
ncbi:MAG: hypothetical protein ABII82_17025 [Verrucomicrobiota bacterium]